jgi:dimethylaniline monooxygenase (N-oxide forming)
MAQFRGIVLHSSQFASHLDKILEAVKPVSSNSSPDDGETVVVVGGGKSAQELVTFMCIRTSNTHEHRSTFSMATKLVLEGRKVAIVFETSDAFIASTSPTPAFIRKGRFVSS